MPLIEMSLFVGAPAGAATAPSKGVDSPGDLVTNTLSHNNRGRIWCGNWLAGDPPFCL